MYRGYPHKRSGGGREIKESRGVKPRSLSFFFSYIYVYIYYFGKANEIKKAEIKCKKENKNYIQQGQIEFIVKEYPDRADLPSPHYSPDGQNAREMDLSVGH